MRFWFFLCVLIACTPAMSRATPPDSEDLAEAVAGNNRFACDLYGHLSATGGNVLFSPYSISTALAMACGGARTVTEREMATVLHFSLGRNRQHQALSRLQKTLAPAHGPVTLHSANSLWAQDGYRFLPEFIDLVATRYGAQAFLVDFVRAADVARERINGWSQNKTKGTIKGLIPPGLLTSLTRLVLCNAVYFKAPWQYRFDPATTSESPFYLTPDSTVTVPMMSQRGLFGLLEGDGFWVAGLPYVGEKISLVVILPHAGVPLSSVEREMTWENLERWLRDLDATRPQKLTVMLPRFSMTARRELVETLAAMGMPHAFQGADFSGMTGRKDLFISNVIHKAFVEVTEEGTEASATTAVVLKRGGGPASFEANRPFAFLIREHPTGSLLFMGRLEDPMTARDEPSVLPPQ